MFLSYIYLGRSATWQIVNFNACNPSTRWLATHKLVGSECHRLKTRNFLTYNLFAQIFQLVDSQLPTCWLAL